jgi:hypothetical protein
VTLRADGVLAASGVVGRANSVCEIATLSSLRPAEDELPLFAHGAQQIDLLVQ